MIEEWNYVSREDIYDAVLADDIDKVKTILDRIINTTHENLKFVDDLLVYAIGFSRLKTVKLLIECYNANINTNSSTISFLLNSNSVGYCLKQYMLSLNTTPNCDVINE